MSDRLQDRFYLDLKGARERLCRAQVLAEKNYDKALLGAAVDLIDRVGAFLPQWSKHDLPEVEAVTE